MACAPCAGCHLQATRPCIEAHGWGRGWVQGNRLDLSVVQPVGLRPGAAEAGRSKGSKRVWRKEAACARVGVCAWAGRFGWTDWLGSVQSDRVPPNPILVIPVGGQGVTIAGGPKVDTDTHTGEACIADGPEGHERTISEQYEHVVGDYYNDDRKEANLGCVTRTDQEGETPEIEDWVDKDEQIEKDESSTQIEKDTATNDGAIVVSSGPEKPTQLTMTYTGQGIFAPIEIRMINWAMHFLPKIDPTAKGKGMLEVVSRPNPVEDHCHLVLNTVWEYVSSTMAAFYEWMHFRTMEEPAANQEDPPHNSATHSNSKSFSFHISIHNEKQDNLRFYHDSNSSSSDSPTQSGDPSVHNEDHVHNLGPTPTSEVNNTDYQGPNPSNLQMVVYTRDREENTPRRCRKGYFIIGVKDNVYGFKDAVQSSLSMIRWIWWLEKLSLLRPLETTVILHLTEHQLQLASDLDFVKLQMAELVNQLKETGDAKNGKSGQSGSRPGEGSGRQREGAGSTRETRSEHSQAGQGKISSVQSGMLVEDKPAKSIEANVTHDVCESVKYDDQFNGQLNHKGKNGIGYVKPEKDKPSWLTNRLQKDKEKDVPKSSVPNQQRRGSTKAKSVWIKVQPKRDLNDQSAKPKFNKSHKICED
ncbi:hypothetical protein F511_18369 [Dorcoceras hygrometricum]|uniref:Uncharacterized protein n=1 Tax=Dorcoceras hygrometricum TaxID=472368 RepID=A0A2Z7C274_9LAMI|nr:hypothetical protein F511_18369 [Dorcoceras hygrometricum]